MWENLENQFVDNYRSFESRFRFNGKEWDEETGNFYYGARYYDPKISVWLSVDPKAYAFPDVTPYSFNMNNPIMMIDPGGDSTFAVRNDDGKFTVDGGTRDDHTGIYVAEDDGSQTLIGYSATPESFFDPDDGNRGEFKGTIDPNDLSGGNFLNKLDRDNPGLVFYSLQGYGEQKYDFKATNGTRKVQYEDVEAYYRGMPLPYEQNSKPVYGSARDIGNIGAGLVAGKSGISWSTFRSVAD